MCVCGGANLLSRPFGYSSGYSIQRNPQFEGYTFYRELRLPQNGSKPSSAKDVLQKLTHLHELPQVILEWRKLNASVTKVVFPMSRAAQPHKGMYKGSLLNATF